MPRTYVAHVAASPEDDENTPARTNHRTMLKPIPVSTLARFAADPESFTARHRKTSAAARHGIRWHEALTTPRRTGSRVWVLVVAIGLLVAFFVS